MDWSVFGFIFYYMLLLNSLGNANCIMLIYLHIFKIDLKFCKASFVMEMRT